MSWAAVAAAGVGAAGGLMASNKKGSTTVNTDPWAGQSPHLLNAYDKGLHLQQNQLVTNPYLSNATTQSQGLISQRALSGSPLNRQAQDLNLSTMRGDFLDLSKNPAAQSAMDMARSGINSQFSGDNYGNSAHQEWLSRGLMSAAAPFYESERQRQTGAMAMAPTLANQDYADLGQLQAVGSAQDARAQELQEEPWKRLERYLGIVSGSPGGSTTQPYFTNPAATAVGAGLGGLGIYNAMNQGGLLGNQMTPTSNFAYNGMGVGGYQYG